MPVADPDSYSEDHEGVLVPEPTGPPHSSAGEEDAVEVRPRQQLQRGETQAGHLDVGTKDIRMEKASRWRICREGNSWTLNWQQSFYQDKCIFPNGL